MVHAYAGSRAGLKSVITICELNAEATKAITPSRIIFDGHEAHQTCEGPKMYKRNDYYYIFHPAGGVPTGWQVVLRSKNIYGPYEWKTVLAQGNSPVNGPHQGAWVDTPTGEDWFLHFQDVGAYGRIMHLQPMKWVNDWPIIGIDKDGDGCGEPVLTYKKPNVGKHILSALHKKVTNLMGKHFLRSGNGMLTLMKNGRIMQVTKAMSDYTLIR